VQGESQSGGWTITSDRNVYAWAKSRRGRLRLVERLHAERGDAKSINTLDTLCSDCAHSVGHRQEADLLGFAVMVNPLTLARHRAREA
jgi:hypothetical protein